MFGMIEAESFVTTDIVKKLKGSFCEVSPFSTIRKIERFSNNDKFDIYKFDNNVISKIIKEYNPQNKKIYVTINHMYCKDKFTILFFSMKIAKQRNTIMV